MFSNTKITKATVKSFIKKYLNNGLHIKTASVFDNRYDGCGFVQGEFAVAIPDTTGSAARMGVSGAWCSTQNFYESYDKDWFVGITVSNCCGKFTLAIKKTTN